MAAWGYGLLGPVEVRVDGRAVPLPGARQRLVLTLLLVDVNRMVPASRLVDEALALWRGPAVSEFADRPFALATVARLDELRLVAAERRAELLLIAGLAEEAAATLQALLAEHPEREQARGLFMQALYRAGRHTEALSTFRTWRRYLA